VTALDLAVAWVRAGGREGADREALVRALHGPSLAAGVGWACPGGGGVHDDHKERALRLWKAAARRAIAREGRAPTGGRPVGERVEVRVLVTLAVAAKLARGERVKAADVMPVDGVRS